MHHSTHSSGVDNRVITSSARFGCFPGDVSSRWYDAGHLCAFERSSSGKDRCSNVLSISRRQIPNPSSGLACRVLNVLTASLASSLLTALLPIGVRNVVVEGLFISGVFRSLIDLGLDHLSTVACALAVVHLSLGEFFSVLASCSVCLSINAGSSLLPDPSPTHTFNAVVSQKILRIVIDHLRTFPAAATPLRILSAVEASRPPLIALSRIALNAKANAALAAAPAIFMVMLAKFSAYFSPSFLVYLLCFLAVRSLYCFSRFKRLTRRCNSLLESVMLAMSEWA
nr:MAG TPA: hypothetical protein [Caudoviricetes sp.]